MKKRVRKAAVKNSMNRAAAKKCRQNNKAVTMYPKVKMKNFERKYLGSLTLNIFHFTFIYAPS